MKKVVLIILGVAALGGLVFSAVMYFTGDDLKIASDFVTEITSGQIATARDRLHVGLQEKFPLERLQAIMEGAQPVNDISFGSIKTSNGATTLEGKARTASGCASALKFRLLEGQIIAFEIAPICK